MNIAEFKIKLAEEIVEERESLNQRFLSLEVENIKQIRGLVIQFALIGSAIIGFTLPVLDNVDLVRNSIFLVSGMSVMLFVVVLSLFYLTKILQKENNELKLHGEAYNDFLDKKRNAKIKFMKDKSNPNSFKEYDRIVNKALVELDIAIRTPNRGNDYALDIIFSAFFMALLLIVLSMIDFYSIFNFLKEILSS